MTRILFAMATLAALLVFGAPARAQQADIACTSIRDARMECPLAGRVAEITLLRQTSKARCIQDRTWGVQRGNLWVNQGCAGVFRVFYAQDRPSSNGGGRDTNGHRGDAGGHGTTADGQIVACGSVRHRLERCAIPREAKWVQLRNRTSDAACIWRQSWATETGAIWVDRGCSGWFELSNARRAPGGGWHEIATGGGRLMPPVATQPAPWPGQPGHQGSGRHPDRYGNQSGGYGDDRGNQRDALEAIRLCRRHGEDRPQLFDARWVTARAANSFRVNTRGNDIMVEGTFDLTRRGRDGAVTAVCRVRNDRVIGFSVR